MGEFVNISDSEETLMLNTVNSNIFEDINDDLILNTPDTVFIEPIKIEEQEEQEVDTCNDCVSQSYGEWDSLGYFKKENYLSELVSEYERALARENLGIADSYAMLWGNISGNIMNQPDLINWVKEYYTTNINRIVADLNEVLNTWEQNITTELAYKANINSPEFSGIPTAPLPPSDSNSSQIATTAWVNSKLQDINVGNILATLSISPSSMYIGDSPVSVVLNWTYSSTVTRQYINNIEIPINLRTYTMYPISSDSVFTLKYEVDGVLYKTSKNFTVVTPFLYGTNLITLNKTASNEFYITANQGEFIYVLAPGHSDALISVNGWVGGFILEGSRVYNNVLYYIYRSANSSLGTCKVKIEW